MVCVAPLTKRYSLNIEKEKYIAQHRFKKELCANFIFFVIYKTVKIDQIYYTMNFIKKTSRSTAASAIVLKDSVNEISSKTDKKNGKEYLRFVISFTCV